MLGRFAVRDPYGEAITTRLIEPFDEWHKMRSKEVGEARVSRIEREVWRSVWKMEKLGNGLDLVEMSDEVFTT